MSELNNLIPISYDNPERPTVSGRELHEFLQVGADYRHWFPRMCEYGFTEGEDFNPVKIDRVQNEGGRKVTRTVDDHQLTIPMAKELCMIQRNERGKQARQYFLAVEAQWNSPEAVMRRAVLIAQKQNDQLKAANRQLLAENSDLKPDAEYARAVCVGKNCRTTTTLAKDYGLSAEKLNSILHGLKIQYKTSDGQWVLYAKYCGKGYTKNRKSTPFQHKSTGEWDTKNTTVWTEAGQRFIYEQLKAIGMLPSVERRQSVEQMELAAQQNNQDGVA
jgi:anti-repressor protein